MYSTNMYNQSTGRINQSSSSYISRSQGLDLKCSDCAFIAWDYDQLQAHIRKHRNLSPEQYSRSNRELQNNGNNNANYNFSMSDYGTTDTKYESTSGYKPRLDVEYANLSSIRAYQSQYESRDVSSSYQRRYESRDVNNEINYPIRSFSGNAYESLSTSHQTSQNFDQYDTNPIKNQGGKPSSRERGSFSEQPNTDYYYKERAPPHNEIAPRKTIADTRMNYSRPPTWENESNNAYGYVDHTNTKRMKPNPTYYDTSSALDFHHSKPLIQAKESPDVWCKPDPNVWQAPDMLMTDFVKSRDKLQPIQAPTKRDQYIAEIKGFYCKLCETVNYYNHPSGRDTTILHHCKTSYHQKLLKTYLRQKNKPEEKECENDKPEGNVDKKGENDKPEGKVDKTCVNDDPEEKVDEKDKPEEILGKECEIKPSNNEQKEVEANGQLLPLKVQQDEKSEED